jgi:hypothetical protein
MRIGHVLAWAFALPVILEIVWWFAVMTAAMVRGQVSACPRCQSSSTRLSTPRLTDVIFPAFVRARRCENCEGRFFSLRSVDYTHRGRLIPETAASDPRSYFVI